jgi:hypothetical protein
MGYDHHFRQYRPIMYAEKIGEIHEKQRHDNFCAQMYFD